MYASLLLKAFLVVPGTPPFNGVAVSSLTQSKSLRKSPLCCFPRTLFRHPNLRRLSHHPLQRWRGPYRLGYISKTSTSLCFVKPLLGSNDDWLWKGTTSVNIVTKLMSVHLFN